MNKFCWQAHLRLILCLGVICYLSTAATSSQSYIQEQIEGYSVRINPTIINHPQTHQAVRLLSQKLAEINKLLPPSKVIAFQQTPIWVEASLLQDRAMWFHPSRDWLISHHYQAEKAGGVEIANTANFINWQALNQPYMVLHEFAHAYHFKILGESYTAIQTAYTNAIARGLYQQVNYNPGNNLPLRQLPAYGRTNFKEYFAELTEAYFGRNDYYPFTRTDLAAYDPEGYSVVKSIWSK